MAPWIFLFGIQVMLAAFSKGSSCLTGKTFSKDAEMFKTCLKTNGRFLLQILPKAECPKQEYDDEEDYFFLKG